MDAEPDRLAPARLDKDLAWLVIKTSRKRSSARFSSSSSQLVLARELRKERAPGQMRVVFFFYFLVKF